MSEAGIAGFEIIGIDSEPDRNGRAIFGFNYFRVGQEVTSPPGNTVNTSNQRRCLVINGSTGELLLNFQPGLLNATIENQMIIDAVNSVTAVSADPFAEWAVTENLPEGEAGEEDDADGDGLNNLLEYAMGSDPNVNDLAQISPRVTVDAETQERRFVFQRSLTADVEPFDIQGSTDLDFSSPLTLSGAMTVDVQGEVEVVTIVLPASNDRLFLRLVTSRTP